MFNEFVVISWRRSYFDTSPSPLPLFFIFLADHLFFILFSLWKCGEGLKEYASTVPGPESQQQKRDTSFSELGPLKDDERRDLNCAIKEYLLIAGYRLTAMTFYEEVCKTINFSSFTQVHLLYLEVWSPQVISLLVWWIMFCVFLAYFKVKNGTCKRDCGCDHMLLINISDQLRFRI